MKLRSRLPSIPRHEKLQELLEPQHFVGSDPLWVPCGNPGQPVVSRISHFFDDFRTAVGATQ